ncbi:MAG: hypothetical protein ACI4MB_03835 [Candidatus Coproplasma sp.]
MQLLILVAMLMLAGQNGFAQIKPIIEEFGGEEVKSAVKQAEELSQIISAVQTISTAPDKGQEEKAECETPPKSSNYPLDPIKPIADERTLNALSKYIALGE